MPNDYTNECLIRPIPAMCGAAVGYAGSGPSILAETGNVTYTAGVIYPIGTLQTHIPSYNPAFTTLSAYNFNASTMSRTWTATVYTGVSGGHYESAGATSGGVCAADSYDTTDSRYTVVAWTDLLNSGSWVRGGGYYTGTYISGGCDSAGDCSVGYCSGGSWGYFPPGAGITSPPSAINTLLGLTVAPAIVPIPGPGGGGSGGGDCDIFIGVVTTAPPGGFGVGTVASAVFSTDGSYRTSGANISVVFPYLS